MTNEVKAKLKEFGYSVESTFTRHGMKLALITKENEDKWRTEINENEIFARVVNVNSTSDWPAMVAVIYDTKAKTVRELAYYNDNFDFAFETTGYKI